jgi:hypothetical protein
VGELREALAGVETAGGMVRVEHGEADVADRWSDEPTDWAG